LRFDLARPTPSTLEAIMADRGQSGRRRDPDDAPVQSVKTVRGNVTFPEDVLSQIDAYAEREGFTRSGFLAQAAKKAMVA